MPSDRSADRPAGDSTQQATRGTGPAPSWKPFVHPERVDETGSTNSDLLERAAAGAPEGTVLLAERQTAGRGRLGRRWLDAPGGSILCSVLFRPTVPIEQWHLAGWIVALAAADAARQVAGVECRCKWPNDLMAGLEDQKVAGVLAEVGTGPEPALVVGIGMNCNWPAEFPPAGEPEAAEIAARAISLDRIAGGPVDRDAVASAMLANLAERAAVLSGRRHVASLQSEYRERCSTIGRLVRVALPDEELVGRALDVDDGGRLLVDVGACVRVIDAGDVVHVRPGDPASQG